MAEGAPTRRRGSGRRGSDRRVFGQVGGQCASAAPGDNVTACKNPVFLWKPNCGVMSGLLCCNATERKVKAPLSLDADYNRSGINCSCSAVEA
jgi:hypothetical protein